MPCCQAPRVPDILTIEFNPSNDNYRPTNHSVKFHEGEGYRDCREKGHGPYRRILRAFVAVLIIATLYAQLGIQIAYGAEAAVRAIAIATCHLEKPGLCTVSTPSGRTVPCLKRGLNRRRSRSA
jgi:hypothetical protein